MSEAILPDVPSQDLGNSEPVGNAPTQSEPASSNVYDAFRSLPDFEGQDDVSIAQNLYISQRIVTDPPAGCENVPTTISSPYDCH